MSTLASKYNRKKGSEIGKFVSFLALSGYIPSGVPVNKQNNVYILLFNGKLIKLF